ncbi:hypothetical protein RB195_024041 [Necator americanus]|uniref:Uncharacterized protein n=1 Tax=Necator americanus TaxID=51031 RepID=A0ABR1EM10_NECAM
MPIFSIFSKDSHRIKPFAAIPYPAKIDVSLELPIDDSYAPDPENSELLERSKSFSAWETLPVEYLLTVLQFDSPNHLHVTLITEMLNGLGAQLGAWEKFEDPKAGVISYFHKAFYKTFIDSGMKDFAVEVIKKYPGFRVWCKNGARLLTCNANLTMIISGVVMLNRTFLITSVLATNGQSEDKPLF